MASGKRIMELDALRAVAVISMVIGHVANYSFLWRVSHFPYYVWDGAQLFMLVSGLVLGMVYRPLVAKRGTRTAAGKLLRRAGLLYLLQVALVAIAIWAYFIVDSEQTQQFKPKFAATLSDAVRENFVLGVNPIYVNFLSVYVLVLLLAIPGVWLLSRGHWLVLVLLGVVQYVAGLMFPAVFTLPLGPREGSLFNNGTWGALFLSGMIVGWYWRDRHVSALLARRWLTVLVSVVFLALIALAIADVFCPESLGGINPLFDKRQLGFGRVVSSWVFFIVLWRVATDVEQRPWGPRVLEPMAVLGARALDAVVILTLAAILIPTLLGIRSDSKAAEILSLVVLALCWAWAYARRAHDHRRLTQRGPEAVRLEPSQ